VDGNGATPSTLLEMLDEVTTKATWRLLPDADGHLFDKFGDFVTAQRPYGVGLADKGELRKFLALQHREEREPYLRAVTCERMAAMRRRVVELLNLETEPERPLGRPRLGEEKASGTCFSGPTGNATAETIVARLKRDAPHDPQAADLATRVISGQETPNAAARQMGWRKPRIVLSTPDRVALRLRAHFTDSGDRQRIAQLLTEQENQPCD
jgi:hypothetical protein